ncbi:hypothetical protein RRG08_036278 [Elysia crispata]|uniref:Uncharacterized protein n=1 Tax=Elysia crispata TaxID=231223 RepID=A0AAE0ZSU1_9GAST|nr:hypothetical protein RRG08_036278 [Elysia crispata]
MIEKNNNPSSLFQRVNRWSDKQIRCTIGFIECLPQRVCVYISLAALWCIHPTRSEATASPFHRLWSIVEYLLVETTPSAELHEGQLFHGCQRCAMGGPGLVCVMISLSLSLCVSMPSLFTSSEILVCWAVHDGSVDTWSDGSGYISALFDGDLEVLRLHLVRRGRGGVKRSSTFQPEALRLRGVFSSSAGPPSLGAEIGVRPPGSWCEFWSGQRQMLIGLDRAMTGQAGITGA